MRYLRTRGDAACLAAMFVGHFALGFAAKRATPRTSLATLFVAAQLADLLWPALLALGLEQVRIDPGNTAWAPLDFVSYPYSHSLLLLVVWGAIFGIAYARLRHDPRAGWVIAALVVSHWMLDVVVHRPDLPLYPRGPKLGLGLWNSIPATLVVELGLFVIGVWVYARSTRARDRVGTWAFWLLVVFLLAVHVSQVGAAPPPSVQAIYWLGLIGGAVLILWAWWADRHRMSSAPA